MVKMLTVNGFIFVPWLVVSGDGLIDWHSHEDTVAALKVFAEWMESMEAVIPMIEFKPKSNTLADWI
jgi:hypothetical protein